MYTESENVPLFSQFYMCIKYMKFIYIGVPFARLLLFLPCNVYGFVSFKHLC